MTRKSVNIYGNRHPKRGSLVANPIPIENVFWYNIFQPIVDAINKLYTGASNVFKSSETIWLGVDNTINVNKEIFNKIGGYSVFGGQNIPCATINGQQIIGNDSDIVITGGGQEYTAGENISITDYVISAVDTKYTAGNNIQINNGVISATDTTYGVATTSSNGLMSAADKIKINKFDSLEWKIIEIAPPEKNQIKYKNVEDREITPIYTGDPSVDFPKIADNIYNKGLGLLTFAGTIEHIPPTSFKDTTLSYIEIPETVTALLEGCFENTSLKEITIPKNVTNIQDRAFNSCIYLIVVKYNGTISQYNNITFGNDVFGGTNIDKIVCIDGIVNL